jgi:anthranilate/para-aminobenzoate synthase component I
MWTLVPVLKNKKIQFLKFSKPLKARVYYSHYYVNLLTGRRVPFSLLGLEKEIKRIPLTGLYKRPIVWHFFYELGHRFVEAESAINKSDILAIQIEYKESSVWKKPLIKGPIKLTPANSVGVKEYGAQFKKIGKELLAGNIYQANLTKLFKFNHDVIDEAAAFDWCAHFWRDPSKVGSFAHASFIPGLSKFYFSNSPECLFQIKTFKNHRQLWSMPIKGTLPLKDIKNKNEVWQKLKNDKKNSAELLMICDLLWNDLNRIEKPCARVEKIKYPIVVNKILHQASLLSVKVSKKVDFLKIISSLFPGGSIAR